MRGDIFHPLPPPSIHQLRSIIIHFKLLQVFFRLVVAVVVLVAVLILDGISITSSGCSLNPIGIANYISIEASSQAVIIDYIISSPIRFF